LPDTGVMSKETRKLIVRRAIEWRKVASEQKDPFLRFIIEYIAFNALCRAKYGYGKRDGQLIEELKKDILKGTISPNKIKRLKELTPIKNVRNVHQNRRDSKVSIKDLDDYKNVIGAIYWIRNNLFHGDKRYSFERDQKLVEVGYEILLDINDWLISENDSGE